MKTRWWVVITLVVLGGIIFLVYNPLSWGNFYTRDAEAADVIFSMEQRANNVVVLWLVHDSTGAYCFEKSNIDLAKIRDLMLRGVRVLVRYSDVHWMSGNPCANAEGSIEGSGYHLYYVTEVTEIKQ